MNCTRGGAIRANLVRAVCAAALWALVGCGPSSSGGAAPDTTAVAESEHPVALVAYVVRGIVPVPNAEAMYIEDAHPSADGNPACRVVYRLRADAEGVVRVRTRRAPTGGGWAGLWVLDGVWHPALSSSRPSEPFAVLVNVAHRPVENAAEVWVTDADDRPVPGATVTAIPLPRAGPDPTVPRVETDANGRAVLAGMYREAHTVDVAAPGYATVRAHVAWHPAGVGATRRTEVRLPRATPVEVRFAGARPGDAVATSFTFERNAHEHAHALDGGVATIALPAGYVQLRVLREGRAIITQGAEVTDATTAIALE